MGAGLWKRTRRRGADPKVRAADWGARFQRCAGGACLIQDSRFVEKVKKKISDGLHAGAHGCRLVETRAAPGRRP